MRTRTKQGLAIFGGVVIAVVMMLLGLWQMASYEESTRDTSQERAAEPPTALADAVSEDGVVDDIYGKRVTASGRYLPEFEVLVGVEEPLRVLTAYRMDDGRHIAVVRGTWDGGSLAAASAPVGDVELQGIFLAPDLPAMGVEPAPEAELATVRIQEVAQGWPDPLIAGYVTLPGEQSSQQGLGEAALVLPSLEGSPTHRGYALQWWVFAAGAIAFGGYTAVQLGKDERRRLAREGA